MSLPLLVWFPPSISLFPFERGSMRTGWIYRYVNICIRIGLWYLVTLPLFGLLWLVVESNQEIIKAAAQSGNKMKRRMEKGKKKSNFL